MTLTDLVNLAPVGRVSVVEQVNSSLLALILDGDVRPGQLLSEDEVKNALGVSRVTARSALAELINTGILVKDANRPAQVKVMSRHEIRSLYRARTPVELEAVRFVTNRGARLDPGVRRSIDLLAASEDEPDHIKIKHNLDFHRLLVASARNPWLDRCYSAIEGGLQLALAQSDTHPTCAETAAEHLVILEELRPGNWEVARDLMLSHVKDTRAAVADSVES